MVKGDFMRVEFLHETPTILTDSQSALLLCKNHVCHERSKHIKVKYHFIREKIVCGDIIIEKIHTDVNPFDMKTKILPLNKFRICLSLLHIDTG